MKQTTCFLLLLLTSGTQLCPQASKRAEGLREQTDFGAEGDFEHPVAIPSAALQQLRTSKNPDDLMQRCAENEGISVEKIPPSWFVASEIRLSRSPSSGLVVRGEHPCLGGAHISQFWVLAKSSTGYEIVFRGRADALSVLPTRTNGYRDLQLIIVTQAGADVDDVNFRYRNGHYYKAGHHLEVYLVEPGVQMTPKFDSNGVVCEMQVEPAHFVKDVVDVSNGIDDRKVFSIIDRLVPVSERGTKLETSYECMSVCQETRQYSNVTIMIVSAGDTRLVRIKWRNRTCA